MSMNAIAVLRALWSFEPQSTEEVAVHEGQMLFLLERETPEWFTVKVNHGGRDEVGMVPATYVEEVVPLRTVAAQADFVGMSSTELRVRNGELLRVFDEIQDWALVQRTIDRGGIGYVPSHVVTPAKAREPEPEHELEYVSVGPSPAVSRGPSPAPVPGAWPSSRRSSAMPPSEMPTASSSTTPGPAVASSATPGSPTAVISVEAPRPASSHSPVPIRVASAASSHSTRSADLDSDPPLILPSSPPPRERSVYQSADAASSGVSLSELFGPSAGLPSDPPLISPPSPPQGNQPVYQRAEAATTEVSLSELLGRASRLFPDGDVPALPALPASTPLAPVPASSETANPGWSFSDLRLDISRPPVPSGSAASPVPMHYTPSPTLFMPAGFPFTPSHTNASSNPLDGASGSRWSSSSVDLPPVSPLSGSSKGKGRANAKEEKKEKARYSTAQLHIGASLFGGGGYGVPPPRSPATSAPKSPTATTPKSPAAKEPTALPNVPPETKKETRPRLRLFHGRQSSSSVSVSASTSSSAAAGPSTSPRLMQRLGSRFGIRPKGALRPELASAAAASAERARTKRDQEDFDRALALYIIQLEKEGIDHPDIIDPEVVRSWMEEGLLNDDEILYDGEKEQEDDAEEFDCAICMDTCRSEDVYRTAGCRHKLCRDCARGHIVAQLEDERYPIHCAICVGEKAPHPAVISERDVELAGLSPDLYAKWTKLQLQALSIEMTCTKCKKTMTVDREDYQVMNIVSCPMPKCRFSWCKRCLFQVNPGVDHDCGRAQLEELMVSAGYQFCPGCQTPCEKISGCNHMTCRAPGCKTEFCYSCGRLYSICRGCNRTNLRRQAV